MVASLTIPILSLRGSDGSAAGGGYSDLSEWPRSVGDEGVRTKETTGHRNRAMRKPRQSVFPYISIVGSADTIIIN